MQIVRPDFVLFQNFKDQIACLHYIYNAENVMTMMAIGGKFEIRHFVPPP